MFTCGKKIETTKWINIETDIFHNAYKNGVNYGISKKMYGLWSVLWEASFRKLYAKYVVKHIVSLSINTNQMDFLAWNCLNMYVIVCVSVVVVFKWFEFMRSIIIIIINMALTICRRKNKSTTSIPNEFRRVKQYKFVFTFIEKEKNTHFYMTFNVTFVCLMCVHLHFYRTFKLYRLFFCLFVIVFLFVYFVNGFFFFALNYNGMFLFLVCLSQGKEVTARVAIEL